MTNHAWKNKVTTRPDQIEANDAFAIKVVAVVGKNNDWAAYQGASWWDDERIASEGDKLLREAAEPLFYCLAASGRRYRD